MLTRLQKLLVRPRKKRVAGTCRLALEALESRTVLSATHLVAQALLGDPFPADALRAPFHAEPAPDWVQVGVPQLHDKPRDASDVFGRPSIETPAPGPVNSVRFATEPSGPQSPDLGDVARLRLADPGVAKWNSPLPSEHNPSNSSTAVEMPMLGGGTAAAPAPGHDPALAADWMLVTLLPPPKPLAAWLPDAMLVTLLPPPKPLAAWLPDADDWFVSSNGPAASAVLALRAEPTSAALGSDLAALPPAGTWKPDPPLIDDFRVRGDALDPPRMFLASPASAREEPPMRPLAGRAAPEFDASWPTAPPLGSLTASSDDSRSTLSMTSQESSSSALGGLAALTGQQVFGVADWDVYHEPLLGRLSATASARETGLTVRQEYGTAVRSGSLHSETDGRDPVLHLVDLVGEMRPAGLESDDEGGVIELGDLGSAVRRSLRKDEATPGAIWEEDAADTRERLKLRSSLRDEVFAESRLQDILEPQLAEDRVEQERSESRQADHANGSPKTRGRDEGGTIELAVAAYSTAAWPQADERLMGTGPTHGIGGGSIPMDTGVGLFQAFELAVGAGEGVTQPSATPLDPSGPPASPAAAASAARPVDAAADRAALGSGGLDLPANRALAVPFVLVVVSLLDRTSHRRVQDDPLAKPHLQAVI